MDSTQASRRQKDAHTVSEAHLQESLESKAAEEIDSDQGGWQPYWEELSESQQPFREQADEYVRNLESSLPLAPGMRVLDFGCGFGFVAEQLAPKVGELFIWDSSANMRRRARINTARRPNVKLLDLSSEKDLFGRKGCDLILVNSVVQYMTPDEFSRWLVWWRGALAPEGRIVVSDLIPPDHRSISDLIDLLVFSARRGRLARLLWQAFSELNRYLKMRRARPLTRIGCDELSRRGAAAGLAVNFLPRNLTHFRRRITAIFSGLLGIIARVPEIFFEVSHHSF
jgi:cyclopropane fatty-acyl-phospholipid synthase-like methyltransferase